MSSHHLITCVVWRGETPPFLSKLAREKGVWSFFYGKSRLAVGDYSSTRVKIAQFTENEEINILIEDERLDEIFAYCCDQLRMDEPGRGIVYVSKVSRAAQVTQDSATAWASDGASTSIGRAAP